MFELILDLILAVIRGGIDASKVETARGRERTLAATWNRFGKVRGMQCIGGGRRLRGVVDGAAIVIDTGAWAHSDGTIVIFSPRSDALPTAEPTAEMRAAFEALRAPFELTFDAGGIKLVIGGPLATLDAIDAACSAVAGLARGQSVRPYR